MGYFSNGSEGMMWQARNCEHCFHEEDCPVLTVHLLYNYEQHDKPDVQAILDALLPRGEDGFTKDCGMRIDPQRVDQNVDNRTLSLFDKE